MDIQLQEIELQLQQQVIQLVLEEVVPVDLGLLPLLVHRVQTQQVLV